MMRKRILKIMTLLPLMFLIIPPSLIMAEDLGKVFIRENFNDLDDWRPLHFPKIKKYTEFSIYKEKSGSYLKAESNASASAVVYKIQFSVFEYPKVRWRWKIKNVYKKGNAKEKSGDDFPVRVYIMFKYDPENAPFMKKVRYGITKEIYGEYPPHSILNYIWANRDHEEELLTNVYADEARMIILQRGNGKAGQWITEEVNILDDYHRAFREDPPAIAGLAIMSDSDNTGESAEAYIDFIEVFR